MTAKEDKLKDALETIERCVFLDGSSVSYKWLAYELSIPMETAKQALSHFISSSQAKASSTSVTYLITGKVRDSPVSHSVKLVKDTDLDRELAKMERLTSKHIFSIQPSTSQKEQHSEASEQEKKEAREGQPGESSQLWSKVHGKVIELLESDGDISRVLLENRLSNVRNASIGTVAHRRIIAEPPKRSVFNKSEDTAAHQQAYSSLESSTAKKTSAANFFTKHLSKAQNKKPKDKSNKTNNKPDSKRNKDSTSTSSKEEGKGQERADDDSKRNKDSTSTSSNEEGKSQERAEDEVMDSDEEEMDFEMVAEKRVKTEPKQEAKKEKADKKSKASRKSKERENVEETHDKKRSKKRIVLDSDDDEDMEPKELTKEEKDELERFEAQKAELAEEERVEKERKKQERREAERRRREEKKRQLELEAKQRGLERLGVTSTEESTSSFGGEEKNNKKNTRKVKRQRTERQEMEDEDGFLIVKEVVIEEEVEEEIPQEELKAAAEKEKLDAKREEEKKAAALKAKSKESKQGKLSMFFKKK